MGKLTYLSPPSAHTVEKTKTPRSAVPTEFSDVTPNSTCSSPDNGEHIETETMQIALCLVYLYFYLLLLFEPLMVF